MRRLVTVEIVTRVEIIVDGDTEQAASEAVGNDIHTGFESYGNLIAAEMVRHPMDANTVTVLHTTTPWYLNN